MAIVLVTLAVVLASLQLWSRRQVSAFLARHPAVAGSIELEQYKQLVRRNMYGALAYMALGAAALIASIILTLKDGLPGLAIVLVVNLPLLVLGVSNQQLERRARTLPCTSPDLAPQYERIGQVWVHKALPDF